MSIIKTEHLVHNYIIKTSTMDINTIHVLKDIDFEVEKGEFVSIMGRSGCGKSTFLKLLGMPERSTLMVWTQKNRAPNILWKDELADIRRRRIGFVFQDFYLLDSLCIKDNILLPMILDKAESKSMVEKAEGLAELFGIKDLLPKAPYELSGGEKQRAAICRALINDPEIILADEPTGNLDSKSGKIVMDALKRINKEFHKTILMVTHDPYFASLSQKVVLLKDGQILDTIQCTDDDKDFYEKVFQYTTKI